MASSTSNQRDANGAAAEVGGGSSDVRGTVRIAPAVLIELVELTVQGTEGFAGLRTRHDRKDAVLEEGARRYDNGKIAVSVIGDQIDVAVGIAIEGGANVADLTSSIQRRIGFAVGNMLGMTVRTVDIDIEEIMTGSASS
jgi:uncharacterized alkaline shock family protein YloU